MSVLDKLHQLSLRVLTLCGVGAVIALAVNLVTAAAMFVAQRQKKHPDRE